MPDITMEQLIEQGREALKNDDTVHALDCYKALIARERRAEFCSALAYCLAREQQNYREAVSYCNEAIKKEPREPVHFLLMGRIYLLAGRKKEAIRAFNLGLRYGQSADIRGELKKLGYRKPPPIAFLARENQLNIFLGKLLTKWGRR